MKCLRTAAILLFGVAMACGMSASKAAAETVLRAIAYAPANKFADDMIIFKDWIDRVNKAGAGKIKIDLIGGPEVVPVPEQVNAVSKGVADIVMTFTVHQGLIPEIGTAPASMITPQEERKNGYLKLLDDAHAKINIKVIGRTSTNSGFYIFSKKPITKMADFDGLKIRSHSGYDPFFKALHAVPVGIAISEIYAALDRGLVQAAPYPLFVSDMGVQEVAKYMLADDFWPAHTTFTYMNRRKFDSLPQDQKDLLIKTQIQLENEMPAIVKKIQEKEKARLQKAGMTFTHLPKDELPRWHRLADDSLFTNLNGKLSPDEIARIKKLILR
ncbi:MAG TPA: TRAP transporter substrate-binding protein DctP [Pseudolabrys sp.]|nr:TRAP transporter substrate-binding protein DctP [Pseudolabrys sp.]